MVPSPPPSSTILRSSPRFEKRASDTQLRVADRITGFAGSMNFVYLHVALFALWIFVFERSPWPTLTLIVSLEAIFLSTFVMIGQTDRRPSNRRRRTGLQQRQRAADREHRPAPVLPIDLPRTCTSACSSASLPLPRLSRPSRRPTLSIAYSTIPAPPSVEVVSGDQARASASRSVMVPASSGVDGLAPGSIPGRPLVRSDRAGTRPTTVRRPRRARGAQHPLLVSAAVVGGCRVVVELTVQPASMPRREPGARRGAERSLGSERQPGGRR